MIGRIISLWNEENMSWFIMVEVVVLDTITFVQEGPVPTVWVGRRGWNGTSPHATFERGTYKVNNLKWSFRFFDSRDTSPCVYLHLARQT